MALYDTVILLVKAIVIGVAILGVMIFVLIPMKKNLSEGLKYPESPLNRRLSRRYHDEEEELEIPTNETEGVTNEAIIKIARKDPLKTTQLVRNWLRDKK